KDLTLVTVNSKSDIAVEVVKMPLLHKLIQVSGTVDELVAMAETIPQKDKAYIQTLVTEKVLPPRTRDRLAAAYGDTLVNIKPVRPEAVVVADGEQRLAPQHEAPIDVQFQQFFIDQMDTELDALQEKFLYAVLDQQQKASGSYITEAKNVPDAETEELIRFLMNETMEDAQ
ncbi:MAG: hypothetical protein MJ135_07045, partial [Oscillospiraceae bacterium]|nr:hypothetical protein [Oscillospiraceae bacterium]